MATYGDTTYEIRFPRQSTAEEWANAATHGFALILSVVGATSLLALGLGRLDVSQWIGLVLYCGSVICVFAASTGSHAFQHPLRKHRWRVADQATIYLMIAGTYTPFILTFLPGSLRWPVFGAVWFFALFGFVSKAVLKHRVDAVVVLNYILLGWVPAIIILPYISADCVLWMAAGGILYTVGTVFLSWDERIPFFHAIWHLMVLAAAACHWYAVLQFTVL